MRRVSVQSWLVGLFAALTVAVWCGGCAHVKKVTASVNGNPQTGDIGGSVTVECKEVAKPEVFPVEEQKVVNQSATILFAFDSDELSELDYQRVAELTSDAARMGATKARLEAGCCPIGTDEYNLGLGKRRADAVLDVMQTAGGFEKLAVSVDNYGESNLVTTNPKDYGLNRRCVITLSN